MRTRKGKTGRETGKIAKGGGRGEKGCGTG